MNDHADRDEHGNVVLPFMHGKFNVDNAAAQFKLYIRDDENLLDCKLVSSPISGPAYCSYFLSHFLVILFPSSNSKRLL